MVELARQVDEGSDPAVDRTAPSPWSVANMLCWREIVRFLRQRHRVIGAVGQPVLFWILFGIGMHEMFGPPTQDFSTYFFPGILLLILLFTAIFATISVIEDRKEGFLQGVLVSAVPCWSIVWGKVLGGSILALGQGAIFLLLGWITGIRYGAGATLGIVLLSFLVAWSFTSLGFALAWRMESTQGFHAIMNLFLMPMWLLSGAFFPVPPAGETVGQTIMHWGMRCNPASYGLAGIRHLMFGAPPTTTWQPTLAVCWGVSLFFAMLLFLLAVTIVRTPRSPSID